MRLSFAAWLVLFVIGWLAAAELLVHLLLMSPSHIRPDPVTGWNYPADASFVTLTTDAGYRRVNVNSLGLNNPEIGPKTRPRVLVLGDSYAEAFQLPREQNFVSLAARDVPQLEWINAGRSRLDPVHEDKLLAQLTPLVKPDAILMVLNNGDERDLLADRIRVKLCGTQICDYQAPRQQGAAGGVAGKLMARSALITFLARKYKESLTEQWDRMTLRRNIVIAPAIIRPAGWRPYREGDAPGLLSLIFTRLAAHHPLTVAIIPTQDYGSDGKTFPASSQPFRHVVMQACEKARAQCLDTGHALAEAYARDRQPPTGFDYTQPGVGHINARGHAAVAAVLVRAFAPMAKALP